MTERETQAAALLAWHALRFSGTELTWSTVEEFYRTGRVTNYTGSVQTLRELSNYKLCQELLCTRLARGTPATAALVRDAHRALMERPASTSPDEGGAITLGLLTADTGERDALRDAAVFLLRFQILRPFRDGNAGTAWVMMNYRLALQDKPPILIRAENKVKLDACLETEEPEVLAAFLYEQADAQANSDWASSFEKGEMTHEF